MMGPDLTGASAARPELAEVPSSTAVDSAASYLDKIGPSAEDVMNTVKGAWARLTVASVFETPDSTYVFDALSQPLTLASTLGEDAASVKKALADYASTLADLETKRSALAQDQSSADSAAPSSSGIKLDSDGAHLSDASDPATHQVQVGLDLRVELFNSAVEQADKDCAEALLKILRYPGDQAVDVAQQVGEVTEDSRTILGVEGVAKGLENASRVRPTFQAIMEARAAGQPLFRLAPIDMKDLGRNVVKALNPFAEEAAEVDSGVAGKLGHGIGIAGTVVAGATTFADQWDKDEARHADWSDLQRTGHSLEHAGFVAVGSTLGADIGTGVGEAVGVAVGEAIFPLGGGLIGGFVGGVIGGAVGGKAGELASGGLADVIDKVANW